MFLWSPDGGRLAGRLNGQLLELSAEDGSMLAEHPPTEDDLIWSAKQP